MQKPMPEADVPKWLWGDRKRAICQEQKTVLINNCLASRGKEKAQAVTKAKDTK